MQGEPYWAFIEFYWMFLIMDFPIGYDLILILLQKWVDILIVRDSWDYSSIGLAFSADLVFQFLYRENPMLDCIGEIFIFYFYLVQSILSMWTAH